MYRLVTHIALLLLLLSIAANPAQAQGSPDELLKQARAKLAKDDGAAADALFQQVIDSPDASNTQVEEALFWQIKIYYGDVFGAALLMGPFSAAGVESTLPDEVARQMLLARRAFQMAGSRYLNTTAIGSGMKTIKVDLPALNNENIQQMETTLNNKSAVVSMLSAYGTDPAGGKGMVSMANRFGLYIGLGCELPSKPQGQVGGIRSSISGGVDFSELRFLDWLAEVSLELNTLVNEPGGPDLLSVSRRADERLVTKAGAESGYAKNAQRRSKLRKGS